MPHGPTWSPEDDETLRRMRMARLSYAVMSRAVGRSPLACRLRLRKLKRKPKRESAKPVHREPVAVGPVLVAEAREQAVLSRSLSTRSAAALEATPPPPKPVPASVEAILSLNYETGKLVLARADITKRAPIRDQADEWYRWRRRRPPGG